MSTIEKKIRLAEQLTDIMVDNLTEQNFSAAVGIARIKGDANVGWTDCYERRCGRTVDKYDRVICREVCKRDEANRALNKVRGLKTYCNNSKNPKSCFSSLRRAEDAWDDKVSKINDRIAAEKRKKDQARGQATGR